VKTSRSTINKLQALQKEEGYYATLINSKNEVDTSRNDQGHSKDRSSKGSDYGIEDKEVGTRHGKEFPLALSILKDVPILSTK
jgi:hypothetical protein